MVDVYLSVRLEAGSLHLANYLICATFYYLDPKEILFPSSTNRSCTPRGKHLLIHGVIHRHHPVASGNVNVDCRGLESTFGVPKSSPGPPEKGSTKCHLGLLEMDCYSVHLRFFYGGSLPRHPLRRLRLRNCVYWFSLHPVIPDLTFRHSGLDPESLKNMCKTGGFTHISSVLANKCANRPFPHIFWRLPAVSSAKTPHKKSPY